MVEHTDSSTMNGNQHVQAIFNIYVYYVDLCSRMNLTNNIPTYQQHTYIHPSIHPSIHPCMHACMHAGIHASMHLCMHTCMLAYMHTCIHAYMHTYIHTYIHTYMGIDLKVLVRSFNCESRACHVGNPRESLFRVRESKTLFRESFAKVWIL